MLAIVLVPSVVLLGAGVAAAVYLFETGTTSESFAGVLLSTTPLASAYGESVEEELRLSMLKVAGDQGIVAQLDAQRGKSDELSAQSLAGAASLSSLDPSTKSLSSSSYELQLRARQTQVRQQVDAGTIALDDVYAYYSTEVSQEISGFQFFAKLAPSAAVSVGLNTSATLLDVAQTMQGANNLGVAATTAGGLTASQLITYNQAVGAYHNQLLGVLGSLSTPELAQYGKIIASPAWQQLGSVENAIALGGTGLSQNRLPISLATWQADIQQVNTALISLWNEQAQATDQLAQSTGQTTATEALWGGIAVLLIAVAAFLVALFLSNQLIRRMRRLRAETLELADTELPALVTRLRAGDKVDVDTAVPTLDHGEDELGQVADAFNKAQHTAVAAAVAEAKTREGVNAVFLNLAHRSQVVVHRQLEVLDAAEYNQEDPEQLELLFQLDHLATRARRNAENLVILGGEQPRRQWRNPVALTEIVRAAASETEEYARIRVARLPEEFIVGTAVADLIHLLAELLDNATGYSPPDSRVDVSGNQAGRGVVVEITDQGLGIPEEELKRINAALREPPDFGVMDLSSDSRLGLFVVGRLAARHGVSVRLAESDYCGIRAIVMIPSALLIGDRPALAAPDDVIAAGGSQGAMWRRRRDRLARVTPHTDPNLLPEPIAAAPSAVEHTELLEPVGGLDWPSEEPGDDSVGARHSRPHSSGYHQPITPPHNGSNGHGNGRADGTGRNLPPVPFHDSAANPGNLPPMPFRDGVTSTGNNLPPVPFVDGAPPARPRLPVIPTPPQHRRTNRPPTEGRPNLPRRRRLASLAPQLASQQNLPTGAFPAPEAEPDVPAEQSRDFMSAIQTATRQARHAQVESEWSENPGQ